MTDSANSNIKNIKITVSFFSLAVFVILFPLLVDQLNGFLQQEAGISISISQIVKFGYMTGFLILIILFCKTSRIIVILTALILSTPLFINLFTPKAVFVSFSEDIIFIFKLLTFPIIFLFFLEYGINKEYLISKKKVDVSVAIVFYMIFFALMLSLFGFGQPMYSQSNINVGHKGYFIAGNQLSSLFTVIYTFYFFHIVRTGTRLKVMSVLLIALICSVLMTTKTTLLSFVIISGAIPVLNYFYTGGTIALLLKRTNLKRLFSLAITVFIIFTVVFFVFRDQIEKYANKMSFAYKKSGSIITLLLSARDQRYAHSFELFSRYSLKEKVFGTGWTFPQHYIGERFYGFGYTETDWLDLLICHGFLGVIIIYSFWIYVLILSYRIFRKRSSIYSVPSFMAILLLIINTALSGHILYSAMIGMYLAYYVSLQFVSGEKT